MEPKEEHCLALLPPYDRITLESLKRRELQALCKRHDIKGTGKNVELVGKLLELNNSMEQSQESMQNLIYNEIEEGDKIQSGEGGRQSLMAPPPPITTSPPKSGSPRRVSGLPRPIPKTVTVPNISTNPRSMPAPRVTITGSNVSRNGSRPTTVTATTTKIPTTEIKTNSKKFDLKESLKRSLGYKPHSGPLKPFTSFS